MENQQESIINFSGENFGSDIASMSPVFNNSSPASIENHSNCFEIIADLESQLKSTRTERDRFLNILDKRSVEINRLQAESRFLRQQLQDSVIEKCEAVRSLEEIQHKVTESEFKEKRFIHERKLAQQQIELLTNDLNRNIAEVQKCHEQSSMRIKLFEDKLRENSSELQMSMINEGKLRESNLKLSTKVEELSQEILKINEEFSLSMTKYQDELSSKSRLVELFKQRSEDSVDVQKEVTEAVSELNSSLKKATNEYYILSSKLKQSNIQHQTDVKQLTELIEDLKHELHDANQKLEAAKLDKSDTSITEVVSLYVDATEDLDVLKLEHEQLKETFTAVVHEIEERAPEIQNLREAYEMLSAENQIIREERIDSQGTIVKLIKEIRNSNQKCMELQKENQRLSQLMHAIKNHNNVNNFDDDFRSEHSNNNVQLVDLVRDLAAVIQQVDVSNHEAQEIPATFSKPDKIITNLTKENKNLIKLEAELRTENAMYKQQQSMQTQIMNALENIRVTLEQQNTVANQPTNEEVKIEELKMELERAQNELSTVNQEIDTAMSLKDSLEQAERTIAKLNEDIEELTNQKDELEKKLSESTQNDFISCAGSVPNLDVFMSANDLFHTQNDEQIRSQKRQREDEDDDSEDFCDAFEDLIAEKRLKFDDDSNHDSTFDKLVDDEYLDIEEEEEEEVEAESEENQDEALETEFENKMKIDQFSK